jgi:hypothetical protein
MIHEEDTDLRELLATLREDAATPGELRALRQALDARRPARTRGAMGGAPGVRRSAQAGRAVFVTAVTAAIAAALALLPGGDAVPTSPRLGPLALAAANAQTAPELRHPYRYTRIRAQFTYVAARGGARAERVVVQDQEAWVGARWRGRERSSAGSAQLRGDASLAPELAHGRRPLPATDAPFHYGDGPLATLDPSTLPPGRAAIRRVLTDGIREDRWGPYAGRSTNLPETQVRALLAREAVLLLVHAPLTGDQRAALLDVLSESAAARDLGAVTDRAGRSGRGVELVLPATPAVPADPTGAHGLESTAADAHADHLRLVLDRRHAEVLEWSFTPAGAPSTMSPTTVDTVLSARGADQVGRRR